MNTLDAPELKVLALQMIWIGILKVNILWPRKGRIRPKDSVVWFQVANPVKSHGLVWITFEVI